MSTNDESKMPQQSYCLRQIACDGTITTVDGFAIGVTLNNERPVVVVHTYPCAEMEIMCFKGSEDKKEWLDREWDLIGAIVTEAAPWLVFGRIKQ